MIYLSLEAHKTMVFSLNKQFLMSSHEDGWFYVQCSWKKHPYLKDNNESEFLLKLSLPCGNYQMTYN